MICGGDVVDFFFFFFWCYGKFGKLNVIEEICVMLNGRWKRKKKVLSVWMWLKRW